ncbi:MAG: gephyrin-like molybdotransferase Glp [Anaerolineae bacterium]
MKHKHDLYPMLDVEDAVARFQNHFEPLEPETVPVLEALDRVLAEDVAAPMDIPPLANTAMDGYALRCDDTGGARPDNPRRLRVVADLAAGYVLDQPIQPGTAVRIMTGAPVPPGAEAVAPFEEIERDGDEILIFKRYPHNKNIRAAGEDVKAGQVVLQRGDVLTPPAIGMLAALGRSQVAVHRRPRVAILSTGDEVIEPDAPWQPGKIRDANGFANAAQVLACGGIPLRLGIARDTVEDLTAKIRAGLDQGADLFLTSGGVSVGDFDVVKTVLAAEGEISFWRVRMKPGKPLAFGTIQGVPLLGLPGNPVSAMLSFEIFARPAILTMLGKQSLSRPVIDAVLVDEIKRKDNRRHHLRVALEERDGTTFAQLTGDQGSGILLSMVKADGLAIIPEDVDHLPAGSPVKVMQLLW